ncbi:DUF2069 domain-containing protein, partial [Methylicorpusculum sp.]
MKPSFYHSIAITGFFGLFALLMLWPTVLTESRFPVAMILLLSVTPLLLPMR